MCASTDNCYCYVMLHRTLPYFPSQKSWYHWAIATSALKLSVPVVRCGDSSCENRRIGIERRYTSKLSRSSYQSGRSQDHYWLEVHRHTPQLRCIMGLHIQNPYRIYQGAETSSVLQRDVPPNSLRLRAEAPYARSSQALDKEDKITHFKSPATFIWLVA